VITIGILDVRNKFFELMNKVRAGEEVIIEDSGQQIAKIIPLKKLQKKRVLGLERGKVIIHDDFNSPLADDIINRFYQ
jgi:prevent-host-death family protein